MDIEDILRQLERAGAPFPSAAVEAAIAQQEAITPRLLQILENVAADPSPFIAADDRMDYIFALYLLAKFREPRAYPLVLRIISSPEDTLDQLLGDIVPQDLGSILASIGGDDDAGIQALIEDDTANEWVRGAALDSLVVRVAAGQRARGEIMRYFAGLFRRLPREKNRVWTSLCHSCIDLCPIEVEREIRDIYNAGLTEPYEFDLDDVEEALEEGIDTALQNLVRRGGHLIDDVEHEMSWMAAFQPEEPVESLAPFEAIDEDPFEISETFQREGPKVGRNDPCPCRSGKKFKKCCGR